MSDDDVIRDLTADLFKELNEDGGLEWMDVTGGAHWALDMHEALSKLAADKWTFTKESGDD